MTSTINRRESLKSLAALGAAGTLGGWSALAGAQAKPLTVGVIYVGARDDYGYNQAHAMAAAEVKKLPAFFGCLPSVQRPPQCEKRTSGFLGATARMCGSK